MPDVLGGGGIPKGILTWTFADTCATLSAGDTDLRMLLSEPDSDTSEIKEPSEVWERSTRPDRSKQWITTPWEPEWNNSVAFCVIIKDEAASDMREFLQYHKCAPRCRGQCARAVHICVHLTHVPETHLAAPPDMQVRAQPDSFCLDRC